MKQTKFVIVGTAGHIDHGKTALVRALTGKNTDRLKEEQARGISIDIDFAPLRLDDNLLIGMVDVPGHERFIRNMLAGAAGIDAALLTIDVNEGIKPQTLEHLAILEMLGIHRMVVALTKCDAADADWTEMVKDVVREELSKGPYAEAPIVPTSAVTGKGLPELKQVLHEMALDVVARDPSGAFRLPVDKVFSIPGFGTVVSGTIWRGTVEVGQHLEHIPGRTQVRVRGIQSHGKAVQTAEAGQRAALNLVGISHEEIHRGHVVAAPGTLTESRLIDIRVSALSTHEAGITHRDRVHVHLGTAQAVGRVLLLEADAVEAGTAAYAQLLLDTPLVCETGDHFVLRSYSPVTTIGGGHVVNPAAARLYRRKRPQLIAELVARDSSSPIDRVARLASEVPVTVKRIASNLGMTQEEAQSLVETGKESGRLVELPGGWLDTEALRQLMDECLEAISEGHRKHRFRMWLGRRDASSPRLSRLATRDLDFIFQEGARQGLWDLDSGLVRVHGWQVELSEEEQQIYDEMMKRLARASVDGIARAELTGLFPKRDRVADSLLHYAAERGDVAQLADGALLAQSVFDSLCRQIRTLYEEQGEFTVAQARDVLNSSRKPVLNLLETLDALGVTVRSGDYRKVVK